MKKINIKTLVSAAMLIATTIILSRFLSINAWNLKIGFAFVPIYLAARYYGPVVAGIVGGTADFLGAILFPIGAYFPGFTLTAILMGVVFGLLLYKKQTIGRIVIAVTINQLVLGLLLNTCWISILYGTSFLGLLAVRTMQCVVMVPVEFSVIKALCMVTKHSVHKVSVVK